MVGRGSNNQTDPDVVGGTAAGAGSAKKVSSICFNMPAVGLGARPPSIISTSTDEGGFNEPSPEIKAKLKPAYNFDLVNDATGSQPQSADLHYVDVSHRLNPDGSEGENSYTEPEMYSIKNTMMMDMEMMTRGYSSPDYAEKVVYATIKPEVPPTAELYSRNDEVEALFVQRREQRSYHSPQSILDPTRPTLAGNGSAGPNSRQDSIEDKRLPDLPIEPPPPRPPLPKGPPLDVTDDVEYADASDEERRESASRTAKPNDVTYQMDQMTRMLNGKRETTGGGGGDEVSVPESMTADEAERLLSSR